MRHKYEFTNMGNFIDSTFLEKIYENKKKYLLILIEYFTNNCILYNGKIVMSIICYIQIFVH